VSPADKDKLDVFLEELLEAGCSSEQLAELANVLAPVAPPSTLRDRLLSSALSSERGAGRLHRFAAQVAKLLDVDEAEAQRLLDGIDRSDEWDESPLPGVTLYHLDGGPAVADAITGFIQIERGGSFPHHSHLGDEHVLVLQGRCRDKTSGEVFGPGDIADSDDDHEHELEVMPGPAFIYLAVAFGGIDIGGVVFKPGDPRM
jgi:hypothetical protein